jgi:hypothetical protein
LTRQKEAYVGFFNLGFGTIFLIDLAFAWHIIRTGRSPFWIAIVGFLGPIGWGLYIFLSVLPEAAGSQSARRFADNFASAADPSRGYREKLRDVEQVGSADSKRALAEECIRMGRFADAVELYESAMQGPIGQDDVTLIKGLARAKMLSGDGAAAESLFLKLKALDPNAFDADAELDYARALVLQGKNEAALRQYEQVVSRYPGEEARCRFGLLLESMGQQERAQALFREILKSVKGAPSYYRRRQREWAGIARQHLR